MVNAQALATSVCAPPAAGKAPTALRPVQCSVSTRARVRPAYRRVVNAQALATSVHPAGGRRGADRPTAGAVLGIDESAARPDAVGWSTGVRWRPRSARRGRAEWRAL